MSKIVKVKIDQALRFLQLASIKDSKKVVDYLKKHEIDFDDQFFYVNFENIKKRFFNVTGFNLIIIKNNKYEADKNGKLTAQAFGKLIKKGKSPLDTESDHDLFIHILGTLDININFTKILKATKSIKDDESRGWAYECITTFGFYRFLSGDFPVSELFENTYYPMTRKIKSEQGKKEFMKFLKKALPKLTQLDDQSKKDAQK